MGLLELQTLWPFPKQLVREKTKNARAVIVAEMNMGQICSVVKSTIETPQRVFLANRIDGKLISPADIAKSVRFLEGRGL